MQIHQFIFSSGQWIGEGKITFSASPNHLRFYTKWEIDPADKSGVIRCQQQVEMEGGGDRVSNQFVCFDLRPEAFAIRLRNELLGEVDGKGLMDAKTIAWEFRGNPDFEGFEVYELQENGDYMLHGEYASSEEFRTIVDGRIWKKSTS
jgi:hypothetical protein